MKTLRRAWAASAALSLLLLAGAWLLPRLAGPPGQERSLERLRSRAAEIRKEFRSLLREAGERRRALSEAHRRRAEGDLFEMFGEIGLRMESEGAAYHLADGTLDAWRGSLLDLEPLLVKSGPARPLVETGRSFIVRDKTSVYLVSGQRWGSGYVLLFRLLSFRPQFRSPRLADYLFLEPSTARNADLDFWDFQEDLSGFERIFARHKDEYLGHPRETGLVSSLIFPLRLDRGRIAATVTLSLPSPDSARESIREAGLTFTALSILACGLLALLLAARASGGVFSSPAARAAGFAAVLAVLRLLLLLLGRLGAARSLGVFSPVDFAARSALGLTRSPADLFLSASFLLLGTAFFIFTGTRESAERTGRPARPAVALAASLAAVLAAAGVFLIWQTGLRVVVSNSSFNLLRISLSGAFLLVHLSLLASTLTLLLILALLFRAAVRCWTGSRLESVPAFVRRIGRGRSLILATAFAALFLTVFLNIHTARRNRALVQDTLKNTVLSQEEWASFFLEDSLDTVEGNKNLVLEALRNGRDGQEARRLWEKTVIARFNWYSSLEILNDRNETVSRFALNVPRSFNPAPGLPRSDEWTLTAMSAAFIGREKEFLVGHRDWSEGGRLLGRTVLAVSLDDDLLPFLYSANPYFELLRVHSLPSLESAGLGFVVYDETGKILFNPDHLTSGPPPEALPSLMDRPGGRWLRWEDRGRTLSAFCFPSGGRLCALYLAEKTPIGLATEFLKLFFLHGLFLAAPALAFVLVFRRPALRAFLKSYANRVYASFFVIALVPLLLLTVFTRSYFASVFARQLTRAAESDAAFARNVLQDFLYLQREERSVVLPPPEDLVLWISAAVGKDVNLYQNGRLVSSSRREFFDAGVLPVLLDGELRHRFRTELRPFLTQRRRIGGFSFSTLTIPFDMGDSELHLSLPFPFERQETAGATAGLVDFLLLASVFFALAVAAVARSLGAAIVRPVRKLLAGTREVSLGNLEVVLEHKPDDDMKTLIRGFNTMVLSLKQHQKELAEMSQKAAWAEIARKVAHEVKNPLTPIQLSAEHLLRVYGDRKSDFEAALRQSVSYITSEVENLRKIAQEFLEISRDAALLKEPADLRDVLKETLAPYRDILTDRISLRESYVPVPLPVLADGAKLKTAFRNILINSLESISGRGTITVRASREEGSAVVVIEDTGAGMSAELLGRIFETYFSTKPSGTGLGLPIARKIVEDHGGALGVSSRPGKGTTVTISLPLAAD